MPLVIGFVSQKGGVGKSALARALVYQAHKEGLSVKVCDFDTKQGSFSYWYQIRLSNGLSEIADVSLYSNVKKAVSDNQNRGFDIIILECKGDTDKLTHEIAKASDIVIIPTGASVDDTKPTALLANQLEEMGVSKEKMIFALSLGLSDSVVNEARAVLENDGLDVVEGYVEAKASITKAHNNGRCFLETGFKGVDERNQQFIEALSNILTSKD